MTELCEEAWARQEMMDTVHKCFHLRFLRQSRHLATISVSIHLQIDHNQPYKANFMYKALSSTQWCTPKSLFTYFNHLVNLPSYLFSCIPLCINQGYTQWFININLYLCHTALPCPCFTPQHCIVQLGHHYHFTATVNICFHCAAL